MAGIPSTDAIIGNGDGSGVRSPGQQTSFIIQYYDYYGHLVTTTLSEPTISTIIPTITYSATYSQVATILSLSTFLSSDTSGTSAGLVTLSALIDTASTTEIEIVVLPTASQAQSYTQPSQTSQATTQTSAAVTSQPPTESSAQDTHGGLHGGAIAGIAIGAVLAALFLIALGWCLARRRGRRTETQSAPLDRSESERFEKSELEDTTARRLEWQPKSGLPGNEKMEADAPVGIQSRIPTSASYTENTTTQQELEAVPVLNRSSRVGHIPTASIVPSPSQKLEVPSPSPPTTSSESPAPTGEAGVPKQPHYLPTSAKYTMITESSLQEQTAADASQLNKLKAQERELAEYVEAHESLQKLKNEQVALRERIRAAEERAQRSMTGNLG